MTHPVYELLLKNVTDEFERSVLNVLIEHAGEKVSRPDLVAALFGITVQPGRLANSTEDRRIREAIERLQRSEYPIMASSGSAGYVLATDEADIDSYIGEIVSRQNMLKEKEKALRGSRRWIKFIREYKSYKPAQQLSMFKKPTALP